MDFPQAWLLTILIEGTVLYLLVKGKHETMTIARNALVASSATLPFVWFVFPNIVGSFALSIAIAEMFAFAMEAAIYLALFNGMRIDEAAMASFICNAASFSIGLLVS